MVSDVYDYRIVCESHEAEAREFFADKDEDYVVVSTEPSLCEWGSIMGYCHE